MPRRVTLRTNHPTGPVSGVTLSDGAVWGPTGAALLAINWTDTGTSTLYATADTTASNYVIYNTVFSNTQTVSNSPGLTFYNCRWEDVPELEPAQPAQPGQVDIVNRVVAEHRERLHREHTERQRTARSASSRAMQLLLKILTAEQRQQFERDRYFEVIAGVSRRRYRIREGVAGNIRLVDPTGHEVTQYCCHPQGLPTGDVMLAQKLQLELDEAEFLRLANATPLARQA